MDNSFLPQTVTYIQNETDPNKGMVVVTPCAPGYGATLGNSLRRVLLSSLSGIAIDAIKIKGAKHEFSTIPHVKEDLLEIVLNLKALRLKSLMDFSEPLELDLKVSGEKVVKAKDISERPEIEIVNPDLVIAHLTDPKADFQMKIWIVKGYGWAPANEKSREGREEGIIIIDSIFNQVSRVGIDSENVRVGKNNNYEKITLNIETSGVVSPIEAFDRAVKILFSEYNFLSQEGDRLLGKTAADDQKGSKEKTEAPKKKTKKSKK
jgi:DNA-directed RNA polymerase subunit alpha